MATNHIGTWKELHSLIKILFFMFSNSSWAPYCGSREQSEKMNTDWKGLSYMTFSMKKKKKISPKPTVKSFSLRIPQNCGHTFLQKVFVFLNYLIWCSNKCITWRKKGEITIHFRNFRKCAWKINQFQKSLFSHLFWISH